MSIQPTNLPNLRRYEVDKTRPVTQKARGVMDDKDKHGREHPGEENEEGQSKAVEDNSQNSSWGEDGEERHVLDVKV